MSGQFWRRQSYYYKGQAHLWRRRAYFLAGSIIGIGIINICRLVFT